MFILEAIEVVNLALCDLLEAQQTSGGFRALF